MNEYSLCISLYGNWSDVNWKEPLLLCGKFENGWEDETGGAEFDIVDVCCWSDLFVDLIEGALFDKGGGKVDNGSGFVEDEIGCNLFNGLEGSSFEGNEGGCWFGAVFSTGGSDESNFVSGIDKLFDGIVWDKDKGCCKIEEVVEEDKSDFADDDEFDAFVWGNVEFVLVVATVEDEFGPDIEPLAEDSGDKEEACCGGWDNEEEFKLLFTLFVNFEIFVFDEEGEVDDCGNDDDFEEPDEVVLVVVLVVVVDGIAGIIDSGPPEEPCKGGVWIGGFKAEEEVVERPLKDPLFEFESNE